eukprot:scaffold17552_cov32-Phaeocystis_antarctica.AAC.1
MARRSRTRGEPTKGKFQPWWPAMTVAALRRFSAKALQHGPAQTSAWPIIICQTSFGLLPSRLLGVQVTCHRVAGSDARTRTSNSSGSAKRCVQHSGSVSGSADSRGACTGAAPSASASCVLQNTISSASRKRTRRSRRRDARAARGRTGEG